MHFISLRVILVTALSVSAPLHASRFEFIARFKGERVPGARVCFSKATSDVGLVNRFLSGREVRCYAADDVIEIPAGRWHFFTARHRTLVSSHPFEIEVPETETGGLLHAIEVDMLEAAELDLTSVLPSLADDEIAAVYVSNNDQPVSPAALRHVPPDGQVLVPAATDVTPLVVRGGRVVRLFSTCTLRRGEKQRVTSFSPAAQGLRDIIVQVRMEDVHADAPSTTPPSVRVLGADNSVVATGSLRESPLFHDSFIFFRSVPFTASSVEVVGEGWSTVRTVLPAHPGAAIVHVPDPLVTGRAAGLRIEWTVDPVFAEKRLRDCAPEAPPDATRSERKLTLYRCTPDQARALRRGRRAQCEVVHSQELRDSETRGAETIRTLPAGTYEAALRVDDYSTFESVTWEARTDSRLRLDLAASVVTGRITRGGVPVAAALTFPNGRTASDAATGLYRLLITRPVEQRTLVSVEPCDAREPYVHLVSTPIVGSATIDIEIPSAGLDISVTDAATGARLPDVVVRVFEDDVENPTYDLEVPLTDAEGRTRVASVLPKTRLAVCAGAPKYTRDCRRGVQVDGQTERIALRLQPEQGAVAGRVVANRRLSRGMLWLVRGGTLVATAPIAADNTFALDARPQDVTLVFTDRTYGLVVLEEPFFDSAGTMVVTLPEIPPLKFTVSVAPSVRSERSHMTFRIGDVIIPRTIFIEHQGNTRSQTEITPGIPLAVSDVVPTRDVHVVLGYPYESLRNLEGDMFARPDIVATMLQKRVVGPRVAFE